MKKELMFIYGIISIKPPHICGRIYKYYVFKNPHKVAEIKSSIRTRLSASCQPGGGAPNIAAIPEPKTLHKVILESDIKPVQDAIGPNLFALQKSTVVSIEPVPYGTAKYANIFINNYLYSLGYIMYGVERADGGD